MRNSDVKKVALGGVLAALAVVIMCMGGFVPIATYVCPVLCILIGGVMLRICGRRAAWAWYGSVAALSLLLTADKEATIVFVIFGYYPIIKTRLDTFRFKTVWKLLYFNAVIATVYSGLLYLMGMAHLLADFLEFGITGLVVMLILGNLTFWLLDRLLGRINNRF